MKKIDNKNELGFTPHLFSEKNGGIILFPMREKSGGFTLIETIVAFGLSVIIITAISASVVFGIKNIRVIEQNENLYSDIIFASNTISYWVKQGKDLYVDPANDSVLKITLPDSSKEIAKDDFNFSNNDLEIKFTEMARSVRIEFKINGQTEFATTVAQRN